jgi:hypothetical protein
MKIFSNNWHSAILCIPFAVGICAAAFFKTSHSIQPQPIEQVQQVSNIEELKRIIEAMPDGSLKANLYIVLATEYAGSSIELHTILDLYAKMQMKKMQSKDTI